VTSVGSTRSPAQLWSESEMTRAPHGERAVPPAVSEWRAAVEERDEGAARRVVAGLRHLAATLRRWSAVLLRLLARCGKGVGRVLAAAWVALVAALLTIAVAVGRGASRTWTAASKAKPRRRRAERPAPVVEEGEGSSTADLKADDGHAAIGSRPAMVPPVIFIDPHRAMLGWTEAMDQAGQVEVIAHTLTAEEAMEAVRLAKGRKNLTVLVDLTLAGAHDAHWLIRQMRETVPQVRIVVAGPPEPQDVSWALFMGADSFVATGNSWEGAAETLRRTAVGEVVLPEFTD
jgi:hypothetical protein